MRWPIIAVVLTACIEFGIDPIDSEDPPKSVVAVTEEFVQSPLPAVDILFVVDDTASMTQEQAALGDEFTALSGDLAEAGIGWQVGVVTTDMSTDGAGVLRGSPWVLTPSTFDVDGHFAEVIAVGAAGIGEEAGLAAALTALKLSEIDGVNAGFRRPGAGLHIIFVSDADDASDAWFEGDPVADFLEALTLEDTGDATAVVSALVGDVPDGCVSERGTAQPGTRYAEVAAATGGQVVSICATDFAPLVDALGEVSITYQRTFALREVAVAESVHVQVDGTVVSTGYRFDAVHNEVVFDEAPAPGTVLSVSYLVENG